MTERQQDAKHTTVAVFVFRLPFYLPYGTERLHQFDGYEFPLEEEEDDTCPPMVALRVHHLTSHYPLVLMPGMGDAMSSILGRDNTQPTPAEEPGLRHEHRDTWIEAMTPLRAFRGDGESPVGVYMCLSRCLSHVNQLVRAYVTVRGDPQPYELARESLDDFALFQTLDSRSSIRSKPELLPLSFKMPLPSRPLSDEDEMHAWAHVYAERNAHPFTDHRAWLERAKASLRREGAFALTVNSLQTSVESLLWGLFRSLLVDEGLSSTAIQERTAGVRAYAKLVREELPRTLGLVWNLKDLDSPVGAYWKGLYALRCRVVHEGYLPSRYETQVAMSQYDALIAMLTGHLATQRMRFPRTAMALMGRPGIVRRVGSDPVFEKVMQTIAAERKPYWYAIDRRGP